MYFDDERGTCDGVTFYTKAKQELDTYPGLQQVSDKILKAVCYVYNKSKRDDLGVSTCNFLYFWFGNMLINNLKNPRFFAEAIIDLFRNLNENGNKQICNLPYTITDEGHFKKIKLIFDYFEDYESYKLDLGTHIRSCNKDYYTFLKRYVDTYNQFYKECIQQYEQNKYCEVFREKYDTSKHDQLYSWSCNLKETSPEPHALPGNTEDSENQEKLDKRSIGVKPETKAQQTPLTIPPTHEKNQEMSGASLHDITSGIAITSDDKTTSITSKSITGAVSVAGFLVPSYLMYNVIRIMIIKLNVIYNI
ncbi:hypothetical protein PVBG_05466 [Plasmodium vivax Brazil I]|uniref:Variable surface protein Vir7-like protein n=1 Tax=Plasmodium vivax (strain Brazil I) TaxID=1033975 RepID=A0A0J9SVD2_PLAV1|nr:hypothetical protein PVBG_05466 [Plasmodium vivax Brazil I]